MSDETNATRDDSSDELPDFIEGHSVDGHLRIFRVIGRYSDGTLRTESWNARHSDKCRCHTAEDW